MREALGKVAGGKQFVRQKRIFMQGIYSALFIFMLIGSVADRLAPIPPVHITPVTITNARTTRLATPFDGQGLYESCRLDTTEQQCLHRLTQIAAGGFTLVLNYDVLSASADQLIAYLNQANLLHMRVILALNNHAWWNGSRSPREIYPVLASSCANAAFFAPCATDRAFLDYILQLVSGNAGLWGYYVGDEVPARDFTQLQSFTNQIKALDNTHPRLFVAATPLGIATLNTDLVTLTTAPSFSTADIATVIGQDYYPVGSYPQLPVNGLATIGPQLNTVTNNNTENSGVATSYALVLQAHSFLPYPGYACGSPPALSRCPYPTLQQMQTMLKNLLQSAHPRLILWYSFFDLLRSGNPDYHWANTITAAGFNAIHNPSFEPWYAPWIWRNGGPGSRASGTATQACTILSSPPDSFCAAHIQVTEVDPHAAGYVAFQQAGIPIISGKPTYVSFDAKSENGGTMRFALNSASSNENYFVQTPFLTATWTHYSYVFYNTQFNDPAALCTLIFGDHTGDVWVNSVVITTPS
jgi:hypothetical protein